MIIILKSKSGFLKIDYKPNSNDIVGSQLIITDEFTIVKTIPTTTLGWGGCVNDWLLSASIKTGPFLSIDIIDLPCDDNVSSTIIEIVLGCKHTKNLDFKI